MKEISPNDMAQNALMKMATELKKDPSKHIARLMQFSATVLERKLDIVRQQKVWVYEQEKKGSYESADSFFIARQILQSRQPLLFFGRQLCNARQLA